jgi:hypothetical protein
VTVDLTPGEDQRRSDEIAKDMWLRFAGLAGFRETALLAYRAGREDAAKAIEASDVIYAWQAVEVARGTQQPRTPVVDVTPEPKAPPTDTSWIELEDEWGTR